MLAGKPGDAIARRRIGGLDRELDVIEPRVGQRIEPCASAWPTPEVIRLV